MRPPMFSIVPRPTSPPSAQISSSAPSLPSQSVVDSQATWAHFIDGMRFFEAKRYPDAIRRLKHLMTLYPEPNLRMETAFLLIRSYHASDDRVEALTDLHQFLDDYPNSIYDREARRLLSQLMKPEENVMAAVWMSPYTEQLSIRETQWKSMGINTLILRLEDVIAGGGGISHEGKLSGPQRDTLLTGIEAAHRIGFRVIAQMPLRRIKEVLAAYPEWRDQVYNAETRYIDIATDRLDLFHPGVLDFISRFYQEIASLPLDGMYTDDFKYALYDGMTPAAMSHNGLVTTGPALFEPPGSFSPALWRWLGVRSRHLGHVIKEVASVVRKTRQGLWFGVGLSELVLTDPMGALLQHSHDLLAFGGANLDFYLLSPADIPVSSEALYGYLYKYNIPTQAVWVQRQSEKTAASGIVIYGPTALPHQN